MSETTLDDWVEKPGINSSPIPERFDKTWPYIFKWCYDGYQNKAHVWRIPKGTDGQDTHRVEGEKILGRPVKVTQKDALGLASYVPAEQKVDGTLVAPPHVLVESYYGTEIPDAVHEELAKQFPDAVVRNARISSAVTPSKPKKPKLTDGFEEPEKDIDDPELKADFSTDPKYHLRNHDAAARWAQERFVTPTSEGWIGQRVWRRLRGSQGVTEASTGADHDGSMIALYVPKEIGEKIHVKGGEPVADMHITLAYFVDKAADRDDWEDLEKIVEQFARQHGPFSGSIGGYGVFHNEVDVLWASADLPGINELRHEIVEACDDAGFQVSKDHSFTPHITLEYDHKGKLPKRDPLNVTFKQICFVVGGDFQCFDFTGSGFEKSL